jgi:hypothetical protein
LKYPFNNSMDSCGNGQKNSHLSGEKASSLEKPIQK